jgi:hypothetical protein
MTVAAITQRIHALFYRNCGAIAKQINR